MKPVKPWTLVVAVAMTSVVTAMTTVAVANHQLGHTQATGKNVTQVRVVRNANPDTITETGPFETITPWQWDWFDTP